METEPVRTGQSHAHGEAATDGEAQSPILLDI